jgi:SnoaL-like domain
MFGSAQTSVEALRNFYVFCDAPGKGRRFVDIAGPWIDELFAAIDRKDQVAFAEFLLPDARFRYGNYVPVQGRSAIAETVADFFAALRGLEHQLEDRWVLPDTAIITGTVIYTRHNDSTLRVPFANILKLRHGGIHDYLIFVDNSGLFAV